MALSLCSDIGAVRLMNDNAATHSGISDNIVISIRRAALCTLGDEAAFFCDDNILLMG